MTSKQKHAKALSLEPYSDRTEMPVYPQLCATAGALGGKTQAEIFNSTDVWLESVDAAIKLVGKPDMGFSDSPGDAAFGMGMVCRAPGRELGEDELYQFLELPYIKDPEEYKTINQVGYGKWRMRYLMDIQTPALTDPGQLFAKFAQVGQNSAKVRQFYEERDIVISAYASTMPIFDALSLYRTMTDYVCDLYDEPGLVMDIINNWQEEETEATIGRVKATGGDRVAIFAMRSSAAFVSPDMFDEFVWPALKRMMQMYREAGILSVLHADSDWLPMLGHLTELPKGSVHVELDDATDIVAAYDILRGSQSMRGNVPSYLFAYKNPDDIREYCEPLVQMGMKGGFILGSGCDVPLNAKPENVKALIDMVR